MVSVAAPQILTPATPLLDHWKATEICGLQLVPKNDYLINGPLQFSDLHLHGYHAQCLTGGEKKSHQAVAHRLNIRCSANAHDLS